MPDELAKAADQPSGLTSPIQYFSGVGPDRAAVLARLGIRRAADLVFHFPRSYEQPPQVVGVDDFEEKVPASFAGTVVELDERVTRSGKHMLGALVQADSGGSVRLVWFNQPFRRNELGTGRRLLATGTPRSTGLHWEMIQPQVRYLSPEECDLERKPRPVYPLTEGLRQSDMRRIMRRNLPELIPLVIEVLPDELRQRLEVSDIHRALHDLHFPENLAAAESAQRRFKVQELLVLQLAISLQRQQRSKEAVAPVCEATGKVHARILNRIGLTLTQDQLKAIADIASDMGRTIPMNRLLQGDVGSGKTVVAQYAMLLCVAHGNQAAFMVPTEVLAEQHSATLSRSLASSRVRIATLTGSLSRSQRQDVLQRLAEGEVDLIIGTQALLSADVRFARLGLVIVDEQHKFGVLQRAKLRVDGEQPHYLVLSATPIPRTIAMTEFGDLDVSIIREKPPGRSVVHSYSVDHDDLAAWWKFVDEKLAEGRQAMVITPRIQVDALPLNASSAATQALSSDSEWSGTREQLEASEDGLEPQSQMDESQMDETQVDETQVANAEGIYRFLSSGPLAAWQIGLLHGRLPSSEKVRILNAFAAGELDVLVATTVVEVGIDVPNASVMTILDADRLGLSQLHQLRGRVSRGVHPGYVLAAASVGATASDNARLAAFQKSNDGFELAELDLRIRGAGDLLGTSQSGMPPLKVADLSQDGELLSLARIVARELLEQDPELSRPELNRLRQQTLHRYGQKMQLSDIG
ncbi:MAG: ATP-dependent DNA helicase RecG [bacterium]|nr:ATP-dependent DNA helicase RecG [bacterium]